MRYKHIVWTERTLLNDAQCEFCKQILVSRNMTGDSKSTNPK